MSSFLLVVLNYTASLGRFLGNPETLCFIAFILSFLIFRRLCYYRKFPTVICMLAPLAAIYLKHPFFAITSKFDQLTVTTACWVCLILAIIAWRFLRGFLLAFNPFGRGLIGRVLLYCFLGMLMLYFYEPNLFMKLLPTAFSKDSTLFAMLITPVALTMLRSVRGLAPLALWGGLGFLLLSSQGSQQSFSPIFTGKSSNKSIVRSMAGVTRSGSHGFDRIGGALKSDLAKGLDALGIRL